jgi:large subunit ribosomal protein L19
MVSVGHLSIDFHVRIRTRISTGVEIIYELYNPTITKIEVLKLERRLDDNLAYLRDAPPEYCTFPFDMEVIKLPPGSGVPLNTIQVD